LHQAREILLYQLENPPSLLELAAMVGVSVRTLKRGFPELFGKTVFGYLTDRRMEWAEKLLQQGNLSVTEVANLVGYSNPGHFAAAFKRRFCVTPSQSAIAKQQVKQNIPQLSDIELPATNAQMLVQTHISVTGAKMGRC